MKKISMVGDDMDRSMEKTQMDRQMKTTTTDTWRRPTWMKNTKTDREGTPR